MPDDLTSSQIALLCDIGAYDLSAPDGDKKRDLDRLLAGGYVEAADSAAGPAFKPTAKGREFLGERGAGLNEA